MRRFYYSKRNLFLFAEKIRKIIRPPILLCLIFYSVSAVAAQYKFETWTTEQGLPYKTVNSALQTRDGYIWAATGDGLARFDGLKFTVFNTANSKGLTTNRLKFLAETADGSLWASGEESGLIRYLNGAFYPVENRLPDNKVLSLYADKAKNQLRILTGKGVTIWEDGNFTPDAALDSALIIKQYFALFDNTGALCVKENGVVRRYTTNGIAEYKLSNDSPNTLLTLAYEARDGALWIGVFYRNEPRRAMLYRFVDGENSVLSGTDKLPAAFVNQIIEDRQGRLWLAVGDHGDGGLSLVENGKIRPFTRADGFSGSVSALYEDREDGIWAATAGGLTRVSKKLIASLTRERNNLSTDNIYPLYEDADGGIWAGAWRDSEDKRGGLDQFENGFFTNFAAKGQLASYLVTAIFKDRRGVLWIGAYDGLTGYKDGKFTQYSRKNGFASDEIYAITETSAGDLWFGTRDGLIVLRSGGVFTNFTIADGLPHNEVKFLHESRDGMLWIATRGGLASLKDGTFKNYSMPEPLAGVNGFSVAADPPTGAEGFDKIPAIQIRSIYEDADGTLWFGTYDAGIIRLKNGAFGRIAVKDGLFDNGAFQILEDEFNRFWISSNRGVYRVARQELNDFADGKTSSVTSVAYGVKDGMADAECNGGTQPAGFKSQKDGTLWFPTQKGVVVIDPKALPASKEPPNVVVENCLLDHQTVGCDDIKITPENDALEVSYTGLSFTEPEQIKFRYKLGGLDENWTNAGTRRTAYFAHLPPGDYTFRVAANVDGVWSEASETLKISVKPPFYRTFWFLALCLVSAFALVAMVFNERIKNLEKARAAQEEFSRKLLASQECERQRIAAELHDSLGQELLIIKNWALLGLRNGKKSSEQLGEISETASQAIDEVREIAYNLRPFHLDELGMTKAIESMLDRVAKSAKIDFASEIDPIDGFFPKETEINFYRIVQECVNNLVKHSGATEAGVSIRRNGAELRLSIWDNGQGFDADKISRARADQSGFGLAGIGERARILGGKIVVNSANGQGTVVNLTMNSKDL